MKQPERRQPCASILLLLLLGAGAFAFAFWFVDHRQAVSNSEIVIVVLMGVLLASFAWALARYLRWRDKGRSASVSVPARPAPNLEGTVYGLIPGREYQVIKSFTDHYGNVFEPGERLRFKQRHFLPYDGGHTIVFEERRLYLQEDQNEEILDHFSDYMVLIHS